jgi:hypothetical protein
VAVEAAEIDLNFLRDRGEPAAVGLEQIPINQQQRLERPILVVAVERRVIITNLQEYLLQFYQELVLVDQD